MSKDKLYRVEEKHRGKWIPITYEKDGKDVVKHVRTSERNVEVLNMDSHSTLLRYVLVEEKAPKKAKADFDVETAKRTEMMSYCKDNGIDFDMKWKAEEFKQAIVEFQGK